MLKPHIEKWFAGIEKLATTNGWNQVSNTRKGNNAEAGYRVETAGGLESITVIAIYNEDTGRYNRSAFTTTRNGNTKQTVRSVNTILRQTGEEAAQWEAINNATKAKRGAAVQVTGSRVGGKATIGDKVTYFDMANQDGTIWEVTSTEQQNTDPKWGWSKGYGLQSTTGKTIFSDLRQYGWTFAETN